MLKQKLIGAMLVIASILTVAITKDATASVICLPLGIYIMVIKENIMEDK